MAYENINIDKLESAFNKIDDIDYEKISNLKTKLTSDQWGSPICGRIKTALQDVINEYKAIQKKIENYKAATELIKEYQEASKDYDTYVQKADECKEKYESYKNKTDPNSIDEYWKKYYEDKYNSYINDQTIVQNSKEQLKNRIDNLIK